MRKRSESDIVRAICDYLHTKRYFFWRQNNTGVYDVKAQAFRRNPNTMRGVPDILLLKEGTIYGLEVKAEYGAQSDYQKEFEIKMLNNGGIYKIVRSTDDVVRIGL